MNNQFVKMSNVIDEISMGPFGSDIKVDNFVNEGVPVLNGANLLSFKLLEDEFRFVTPEKAKTFKKAIAKKGDIIITHRGTLGQISYIPEDSKYEEYVISQSQFKVRLNKERVNPAFFVYYFHTSEGQKRLLANKCHVGVPALAQATTNFRLIKFPLPDLLIQNKISNVLLSLDRKIEQNNKFNNELESMAKILYDYWFVQFDFPDENGKPYKTNGGKMVWNDLLKMQIPIDWEIQKLKNLFEFEKGIEPGSNSYLEKSINSNCLNFFRVGDIDGNCNIFIDGLVNNYVSVSSSDVVVTFDGSVGKVGYGLEGAISGGLRKIYDTTGKFDNSLVYFIFKDKRIIANIHKYATGSILLHASGSIEHLVIPYSERMYLNFQKLVIPYYNKMVLNKKESQKLVELRDWLLPMLMNGQVKVN